MLKKALILTLSILCFFSVWQLNSKSYLTTLGIPYETYTGKNSSMAKIIRTQDLKFKTRFNKTGESIVIYNDDIEDIIKQLQARTVFTETINDGVSIYAYSEKLKNKITLNGENVNVQIFIKNNKTVIGTPIIFGSF